MSLVKILTIVFLKAIICNLFPFFQQKLHIACIKRSNQMLFYITREKKKYYLCTNRKKCAGIEAQKPPPFQ